MSSHVDQKENSINILMIGITGHGKSALSNFIFQEDVFQSDLGFYLCLYKQPKDQRQYKELILIS